MKTLLHLGAVLAVLVGDWLTSGRRDARVADGGLVIRFTVKHPWLAAGVVAALAGIGGALLVVSGVVPIKASSGHWRLTARFLDFAKLQSFKTHSLGVDAPRLDDEVLVLRGAAHYETGCYPCHGKPGAPLPPVMAAMTPPPPDLTGERVTRWRPEQLFSIVKHGIKFTGMPAWPTQQRDDEVWAVVAFLRRLPALDAARYERLVQNPASIPADPTAAEQFEGNLTPPAFVRSVCSRCHGIAGIGRGPDAFPSLAGQRAAYMEAALRAFADRSRHSGIMAAIAAPLNAETIREVAQYYERLAPRRVDSGGDREAVARGGAIATRGVPERDIPACVECHGPTEQPKNPAYPLLAGQHARYLRQQLMLLQQRRRGGSPHVNLMYAFVDRLTPDDINDVTLYFSSLQPADAAAPRAITQP